MEAAPDKHGTSPRRLKMSEEKGTRAVRVAVLGTYWEGALLRVYASAEGAPGGTEALVEMKGTTAFIWVVDPMEAAGIPMPRPPWCKLFLGMRWVPMMVVDSVDRWAPSGAEWSEPDPLGVDEALHRFARMQVQNRLKGKEAA